MLNLNKNKKKKNCMECTRQINKVITSCAICDGTYCPKCMITSEIFYPDKKKVICIWCKGTTDCLECPTTKMGSTFGCGCKVCYKCYFNGKMWFVHCKICNKLTNCMECLNHGLQSKICNKCNSIVCESCYNNGLCTKCLPFFSIETFLY